ncbi:type II secretion system protein [Peptoniphilus catoniae]|uniref:type II secretion system protein n=1 Tax=Peptoniphilus catoniae TaxID=1660341 RepID=UPI0010FCFC82|nr:type II secretion system protein [Peptoniphilus catoniae]
MVRSKKKGFILLDVLLSISLIFIVASLLIPAITNLLLARNKLKQRSELYQVSKNQIELITSAAYMGSDKYEIIIPEKYKYRIEKEDLGDNLVRYFLYIEDEDKGEIKFEKILQKKRLYSN